MSDDLVGVVLAQGPPGLFIILLANALGMPFPTSLILMALGSFAGQGQIPLLPFLLSGLMGAAIGDQLGYLLGRLGGEVVIARLGRSCRAATAFAKAEKLIWRWSGPGIYFSRWLLSPLGPWVNLATGISRYPWPRFAIWDFLGLVTWITLYAALGFLFSDRIHDLAELIGGFTWLFVVLAIALVPLWLLRRRRGAILARLAGKTGNASDS